MHETQPVAPKFKHMKFLYTVGHRHVLSLARRTPCSGSIWRALTRHTTEAESMRIRLSVRSATRRHNDITQRQQTRRVLPTSSRQVEAHLPPRKSEAHVRTMAHESSMRRVGRTSGSPKCWFVCAQWHRQGMHTFSGLLSLNCKSTAANAS